VLAEEDGNAVVGSPRGKQHILLIKCRMHHNTSKDDQADAERRVDAAGDNCVTDKLSITGALIPLASNDFVGRASAFARRHRMKSCVIFGGHVETFAKFAGK
jgi:hypothetical protein